MTSAKRIFLSLLPPILTSAYYRLRTKQTESSPEWYTVRSGPSSGTELFVDVQNEAFAEMIAGTYDIFIWQYLANRSIEGEYIIDIGAHVGYHAVSMLRYVKNARRVLAYEPNLFNAERLQMNIDRNSNLTEIVSVRKFALSDKQGAAQFRFSDNIDNATSSGSHLTAINPPQSNSVYERHNFREFVVQTNTLDAEIEKELPNSIGLIKIDVEGAEHLVLRGAMNTISRFKPTLIIEVHSVECMLEVSKIMNSLNYDIQLLKIDRPSRCFITCTPL